MTMYQYCQQAEPVLIKEENRPHGQKVSSCRKRSRSQPNSAAPGTAAPESKRRRVVVKSVVFRNFVEIIPGTSTSSLRDWYQEADALHFRENMKRDVLHLAKLCKENRVREMDQAEYCTIGIEKYCCSPRTRAQFKELRDHCIRAVVEEQRLQKILGNRHPDMLRQISRKYSKKTRDRALQLAARTVLSTKQA